MAKKIVLCDKNMRKLLEDFANQTSICKGGNIEVTIDGHTTSFKPAKGSQGFRYEDGECLSGLIKGAEQFLFYVRRAGLMIQGDK